MPRPDGEPCAACEHAFQEHAATGCVAEGCGCWDACTTEDIEHEAHQSAQKASLEQLRGLHRWLVRVMWTDTTPEWPIRHRMVLAELHHRGLRWCGPCTEWTNPHHHTESEEER